MKRWEFAQRFASDLRFRWCKEGGNRNFQRAGQFPDGLQRNIARAPFDIAYVGSMQVRPAGQFFLGDAKLAAAGFDRSAK